MGNLNSALPLSILLLLAFTSPLPGRADEPDREELQSHVIAVAIENDRILPIDATDRHYTHGTHFAYWKPEGKIPFIYTGWGETFLEHFPRLTLGSFTNRYGFGIAQQIYTPTNLRTTSLIRNDRPYAGWLYASFLFQRRGLSFSDFPTRDNFELTLGLVGEKTFARDTQNRWHRIINVEEAQGWDNQIHDEPALNFDAQRNLLALSCRTGPDVGLDVIPHLGLSLGNVLIQGKAGVTARFGWRLPNDFGVSETKSPALYMFAGVEGRAVAWNMFLDGNVHRSSHHVNKLPFVTDLKYGLTWKIWENMELSYTYTYRTREFRQQTDADKFGSVSLKIVY